jgi:hypothetical protein
VQGVLSMDVDAKKVQEDPGSPYKESPAHKHVSCSGGSDTTVLPDVLSHANAGINCARGQEARQTAPQILPTLAYEDGTAKRHARDGKVVRPCQMMLLAWSKLSHCASG